MEQQIISVDPNVLALKYQKMLDNAKNQIDDEKQLRESVEGENKALKQILFDSKENKKIGKKSLLEKREAREAYQLRQMTGVKSDGKPIPHAGTSIKSYTEFKQIGDYLYEKGNYRDWLIWCLGCAMGLRISDLVQLTWGYFFTDGKFRERMRKLEQKTGKINEILITDYVKDVITEYLRVTGVKPNATSLLFISQKPYRRNKELSDEENEILRTKAEKSFKSTISRNLKNAGRALGYEHKSAHSMRHSFSTIVSCLYDNSFDFDSLDICCALLNHSDIKTTMRYCGTLQNQMDSARRTVSDFLSGKTGVDKLEVQTHITNRNIYELLKEIQTKV